MTPPSTRCRKGCSPEDVLQHSDGTAVTPRVSAIAERLFLQSLHTVKMSVSPEHAALPEASTISQVGRFCQEPTHLSEYYH